MKTPEAAWEFMRTWSARMAVQSERLRRIHVYAAGEVAMQRCRQCNAAIPYSRRKQVCEGCVPGGAERLDTQERAEVGAEGKPPSRQRPVRPVAVPEERLAQRDELVSEPAPREDEPEDAAPKPARRGVTLQDVAEDAQRRAAARRKGKE